MRILFTSLNCLMDPASGAAISVRTILGLLAERGHQVLSVTGACFDSAVFPDEAGMLGWTGFSPRPEMAAWVQYDHGVEHVAHPLGTTRLGELDKGTVDGLIETVTRSIDAFDPDVVLTYGGTHFEAPIRSRMRLRGTKVVFYLANPQYTDAVSFENTDLILTDSIATQELYRQRLGLETLVIGKFIRRPELATGSQRQKNITFVNPSYPKGVTLFYRIAEMMTDLQPTARFLVVESRKGLDAVEEETGLPFSRFRSIRRIGLQANMASVFARTHVLLMPSLWHESGGRTAIEALSLGIPVVASNHGGLPEHLGDGAILCSVPEPLRGNPRLIPPVSAALPWAIALSELWADAEYWETRSQAALQQWEKHDPAPRINLIEQMLLDLASG